MDRLLWPLSNWLWAQLVNPLVASVLQLTPRRAVYLTFFLVFAFAFAYAAAEFAMSADMALLLAGDSALYFEIVTFTTIAFVRGRLYRAALPAMRVAGTAMRRAGAIIVRTAARSKRPLRLPRLFDGNDSDDVPDGAFA